MQKKPAPYSLVAGELGSRVGHFLPRGRLEEFTSGNKVVYDLFEVDTSVYNLPYPKEATPRWKGGRRLISSILV